MSTEPDFFLYGHYASGHSYKVALFLTLADVRFGYESVDILNERNGRPPGFAKLAKFDEVPVLRHGTMTLCQSNAILQFLARRLDCFAGTSQAAWWEIQEWLFWEMSRLNLGVANLRFFYRFLPDTPAAVVEHYRVRSVNALDQLQAALHNRRFLVGESPTIADLSCCGYLFWADEARLDLARWPAVARWLGRIAELPRWRSPRDLLGASL